MSNKPYQELFPRELNCYFDDLLTGKINRPTGHACNPRGVSRPSSGINTLRIAYTKLT